LTAALPQTPGELTALPQTSSWILKGSTSKGRTGKEREGWKRREERRRRAPIEIFGYVTARDTIIDHFTAWSN